MDTDSELDADTTHPISRICKYLSERSPQPMVAVEGATHIVIYLNPAFARLVGKERKDIVALPFATAIPEGETNGCLALLDRVFLTGIPENLAEQEHRQSTPVPVYWSYALWAILGEDGKPAGVMIQVTDTTDTALYRQQTREMNEALLVSASRQHELVEAAELLSSRLQAAVQRRDHFLAVLSHELRNPLASLSSGLQLLKLTGKDAETAEMSRAMMERQLNQMVRLVDDLLDVSRIATGKLELRKQRVDIAVVVRDAVEACRPLIDRGRHELIVTLLPDPVMLDVDPTRLTQVFLNLLNNAAKYSEPGGHIRLSVERDGNEVVVNVHDLGIGITADYLPQVFDAFVQVDPTWERAQGGLGVGLSLVKEFVELHHGRVEVHSDGAGKGSEFIVRLPLATDSSSPKPPAAAVETSQSPQHRILVVDDNFDGAESLAEMLRLLGEEVNTAHDGLEAVEQAERFRPEVILMDLGMPKLNGLEATKRIREQVWGKEVTVIALTGWGQQSDRERSREAGCDGHLVKPVKFDDLQKLLGELQGKR